MKTDFDKVRYESMHKDPENWKWFFYVNRKDPRVSVPKLVPMTGWTLNFGNPYTYIIIISVILILLATTYLL